MTIEEKAKAYDKALSKAREYYFHGQAPDKLAELESIFPELRESEDERVRQGIVETIKQCTDILDPKNQKRMLAYLEKQKEQKPAEWSEEDELMRTVIIQTLEKFGGRGTTEMQIDWLKSLRPQPHWKPSEEQMYALAKAVTLYGGGLDSLYQDLKKLM